jgi:hypothetical protein
VAQVTAGHVTSGHNYTPMPRSSKRRRQSIGARLSQSPAMSPGRTQRLHSESSPPPVTATALNVEASLGSDDTPPPAVVAAGVTPLPPPPARARDDLLHITARKLGIPVDRGQVHGTQQLSRNGLISSM